MSPRHFATREPVAVRYVDEEDLDDQEELEPLVDYYRRQETRVATLLELLRPTEAARAIQRLEVELDGWRSLRAGEELEAHWESGEGDRKLF